MPAESPEEPAWLEPEDLPDRKTRQSTSSGSEAPGVGKQSTSPATAGPETGQATDGSSANQTLEQARADAPEIWNGLVEAYIKSGRDAVEKALMAEREKGVGR